MTTPLRRSARLQQGEDCIARNEIVGAGRKKRRLLPSPSISGSFGEQQAQRLQHLDPHRDPKEAPVASEDVGLRDTSTRRTSVDQVSGPGQGQKRKTVETEGVENSIMQQPGEPPTKRTKSTSFVGAPKHSYWAVAGELPEYGPTKERDSSKKRKSSYTQSTKDGEAPKADMPAFEEELAQHGIIMDELKGDQFASEASKALCETMLSSQYEDPVYTPFPLSKFSFVWDRLRNRNEFRINRDITPVLVPSAGLLYFCGHQDLEHLAEEDSADWTKSEPIGGPKPRLDFAVGIARSAFTDEEIANLNNHSSWGRATLFTNNIRADRQAVRSSSMAVNAIIQLHRILGDDQASKLSGQILVFSVSHTNENVKIYGHYAITEGAEVTFYRHCIVSFTLGPGEDAGSRKRTYDFVREVYHKFYPAHLKRISDALAKMEEPRTLSMTSTNMSIEEEGESQNQNKDAPLLQGTAGFKKPGAPASKRQKGEMALLREQMAEQRRHSQEQLA